MAEPQFPELLRLTEDDIRYVKVDGKLIKGCDCLCHRCCVPMDFSCGDCEDNHADV